MYDVIIAGAGPVGLFLACELRLAQRSVLVLEALEDPQSPLKRPPFGLRGLWGPSIEALYRRGLLDAVAAQRQTVGAGPPRPAGKGEQRGPAGHFAGIQFDYAHIDQTRWTYRVPGPSDLQLGATMDHIETVLAERAAQLGVEIHRGVAVDRIDATGDRVLVNGTHEARWLVGCDGGRSTVRKLAGFEFVGTEPELTGYSVLVTLADPAQLPLGRHNTPTGNYQQWQPGALRLAEFDGGAGHRVQLDVAAVQALVRRITGVDVTVTALHLASTWTDRSMQATTYRRGRVLLAGDAAHIHSPLGGQGLNLGLGDVMNLGWKLAATLRGDAPDGLLDSYTTERHPIGVRILEWTRAQVALLRPSSRALAAVMRDLVETRDGATYFAERVWGVNLRYGDDAHPLVGRSCPDFEFVDGTRLGEHLRDGTGALVDFAAQLAPIAQTKHLAIDAKDRLGLTAVLVRPDGFVAWASGTTPDRDDLARAAARWFPLQPA